MFHYGFAKFGCGLALCGCCTVHVNGTATRSCSSVVDGTMNELSRTEFIKLTCYFTGSFVIVATAGGWGRTDKEFAHSAGRRKRRLRHEREAHRSLPFSDAITIA